MCLEEMDRLLNFVLSSIMNRLIYNGDWHIEYGKQSIWKTELLLDVDPIVPIPSMLWKLDAHCWRGVIEY